VRNRRQEQRDALADAVLSKLERLKEAVSACTTVAVAVSGGVDSTLLFKVAGDVLGRDKVLGLFAGSILQPAAEAENILSLAEGIGGKLEIVQVEPLDWPEFVENPPDRCYQCKKRIYSLFLARMAPYDIPRLLDGTNVDDLSAGRPGQRALAELGVLTPLAAAGLCKADIRSLSRFLDLPNWNRPSASCLATRIPAGRTITRTLLEQVARCEGFLHSLGFSRCRVRLVGDDAHIELAAGDSARFSAARIRESVSERFAAFGINRVLVDLAERAR
jgi:uncharacterized protein